jgi:hypothetical protein
MKSKFLAIIGSTLLVLFLSTTVAYAYPTEPVFFEDPGFSEDVRGITEIQWGKTTNLFEIPKTSFGWNQVPFLHLFLTQADLSAVVNETWTSPTGDVYNFELKNNSFPLPIDFSKPYDFDFRLRHILNFLPDWFTRREIGLWSWSAITVGGSNLVSGNFTITPEPISSALFLLGSATLAMRAYRKRKQKA